MDSILKHTVITVAPSVKKQTEYINVITFQFVATCSKQCIECNNIANRPGVLLLKRKEGLEENLAIYSKQVPYRFNKSSKRGSEMPNTFGVQVSDVISPYRDENFLDIF